MSSTTGEHINELGERRRRRQQRNAQPGQPKPPRSANTAPEAGDLLRDLITNGSRLDSADQSESANTQPVGSASSQTTKTDIVAAPAAASIDPAVAQRHPRFIRRPAS